MFKKESHIEMDAKTGRVHSYIGDDANEFLRLVTLGSALELASKDITLGRGYATPEQLMSEASRVTGKVYKKKDYLQAKSDVLDVAEKIRKTLKVKVTRHE